MGIWFSRDLVVIGLATTILALVGFLAVPHLFNLWMAFLGGGTLIGSGLYIRQRWT